MSKSNKCPIIDSSSSNDRDFRKSNNYQYTNYQHQCNNKSSSPLSHISKYLDVPDNNQKSSKENVELALEVEIDESLKHVLTNAERDSSDLLDVTIIRPSDSDTTHETTVALYKDEVRDFITLVEQHQKHQISETKPPTRSKSRKEDASEGSNQKAKSHKSQYSSKFKTDYSCVEEIPAYKVQTNEFPETKNKDGKIDDNPQHVYATMNTFDKLKHNFACQNKNHENDKPGTPCMCQHCGIIGVLVQSQKGPVAPFPPVEDNNFMQQPPKSQSFKSRDVSPHRKDGKMRKLVPGEIRRKPLDQIELLREINSRIKSLEKRIAIQEETAVPREYLKQILHKVLTQYNFKATHNIEAKLKNNATQYSSKNIDELKHSNAEKNKETKNKCYQIHTVLDKQQWMDFKEANPPPNEEERKSKDLHWLWGEEVVQPGCDLKTKILKLLEDKLKQPEYKGEAGQIDVSKLEKIRHFFAEKEKVPCGEVVEQGIKIEHDEKTIYLDVEQQEYRPRSSSPPPLKNKNAKKDNEDDREDEKNGIHRPVREITLPSKSNKFSNQRHMSPKPNYPFDLKKTVDDSTFKKNIEAQKEKNNPKPIPIVEEKYLNAHATNSLTTESKASMDYIIQKLKNTGKIIETGLSREREDEIDAKYQINTQLIPGSLIKENVNRGVFRIRKDNSSPGSVDVKFVNPKIKHWSEESSTSDDKLMKRKAQILAERKEPIPLEKKESLIYKLDFLKTLTRNKSNDQSRVLNKIWNQAKNTAKSKKDAVYIKIPIKNVNPCETQDTLLEMHLTLEELETVVKSTRRTQSPNSVKVQSYRSTSEIDLGQRKHEELKYANKELLKSRQMSAKGRGHRR